MTPAAWFTLAVVAGAIVLLATERSTPSLTLLGALILLLTAGVVTPEQAFSGFSNPAPITVAALFVLAAAVEKTGALQPVVTAVLGSGQGHHRLLARIAVPSAAASAVLNNTPIVAMLAPQVSAWAERHGLSPSRFLMPLSFASILGGTLTVIGTSTNIVVSGLLEAHGQPALGMFELTPISLPIVLAGLVLLVLLAPVLLPERRAAQRQAREEVREFAVNMRVNPGGPLDGSTVEGAGLRHLEALFLAEIERDGEIIAPVRPTTVLHGEDRLVFVGRADDVVDLQHRRGLVSDERDQLVMLEHPEHSFFEAVVGGASPLVGRTLKEAEFRGRYQAAVVAIHRSGQRVRDKLGQVPLKIGDTLLLLADPGFRERWRDRSDFLLVSAMGGVPPMATRQAALVGVITAGIIIAAATGLLSVLQAALLGALLLLALQVLSPREARAAIDMDVIIVIAAAFGLGAAMEASGLADLVAAALVGGTSGLGGWGVLLGVVVATVVLTEFITNNAAAVLVFPIGLAAAEGAGLDPRAVAIAIAIAASASFLTPIGYQTNTMVYGPGGYRFGDYARLGVPLTLLVIGGLVALVGFGLGR